MISVNPSIKEQRNYHRILPVTVHVHKAESLEEKLLLSSFTKSIYLEEGYLRSPQQRKLFPDEYDFSPETISWYATKRDEIVGGVRIHTGVTMPVDHILNVTPFSARGNIVEISRLCVQRQAREQGVAQQLVSAAYIYAQQEKVDFILLLAAVGTQHDTKWWTYRSLFAHLDGHRAFPISPYFSWKESEESLYRELANSTIAGWYERLGAKPAGPLLLHPFNNIVSLPMYGRVGEIIFG